MALRNARPTRSPRPHRERHTHVDGMKGNSGAVSIDERVTSRNGVALNLVELPPEGVYVRLRRAFMSACVIFAIYCVPSPRFLPWQFLNFLPLPQGQGSLRPTFM